jgi:hypothetical protein
MIKNYGEENKNASELACRHCICFKFMGVQQTFLGTCKYRVAHNSATTGFFGAVGVQIKILTST